MSTSGSITTEVEVLPQHGLGSRRRATLTLRGNGLFLSSGKGPRFEVHCLDYTGATYELLLRQPSITPFSAIAMSLVALVIVLLSNHLFVGLLILSVIAVLLAAISRSRRVPAVHLRLNAPGTVHDIILKYQAGENLELDAILKHFRPFALSYHTYRPGHRECLMTDWIRAFPFRFAALHGGIPVVLGVQLLMQTPRVYRLAEHDPAIPIWALGFSAFCIVVSIYYMRMQFKKRNRNPAYFAGQRKAMRLLEMGRIDAAESTLKMLLTEYPQDEEVLTLLGHLSIAEGRYDDAERFFQQIPEAEAELRCTLREQLDRVRSIEFG